MTKRSPNNDWYSVLLALGFTCTSYSQQCEPYWSDQFHEVGLESTVLAMTFYDDGSAEGPELYIGGGFDDGGGVVLNGIAKFDGVGWQPLGSGMNGSVYALTVFDDSSGNGPELYAAGYFSYAGGIEVNRIAKWDGKAWSALGKGLQNGGALAMVVYDDGTGTGPALYATGSFEMAGDVEVHHIAKWDGKLWAPLGDGLNGYARALAVYDDVAGGGEALYVGGGFSKAGSVEAHSLARWDGANWAAVGEGTDGYIRALTVLEDERGSSLYVGGYFFNAGSVSASSIARWDGLQWSSLGNGVNSGITTLAIYDDGNEQGSALYAGGSFLKAGDVEANRIAKWDGES